MEIFKKIILNPQTIPENLSTQIYSNVSKVIYKELLAKNLKSHLYIPEIESKDKLKYIDSSPILIKDHEKKFEKYKLFLCSYSYNENNSQNVLSNIDNFLDFTIINSLCISEEGYQKQPSGGTTYYRIMDGHQTFSYPNLWSNEILKNDLNIFLVEP